MSELLPQHTGTIDPVLRLQDPSSLDAIKHPMLSMLAIARFDYETRERSLEVYRETPRREFEEAELNRLQMHNFVRMGKFLRKIAMVANPELTGVTHEIVLDCRSLIPGFGHRLQDWHIDAARDARGERIPGPAQGSFVLCDILPTEVAVDDEIQTVETAAVTDITGLKHRSQLNVDLEGHRLWAQILFG